MLNFFKNSSNELNISFTVSIVVHVFIGLALLFFSYFYTQNDLNELELFTEIDFVYRSSASAISGEGVSLENAQTLQELLALANDKEEEIVELPKRRMLEATLPELPTPGEKKLMLEPENQPLLHKQQAAISTDMKKDQLIPMLDEEKDVADAAATALAENEIFDGDNTDNFEHGDPRFVIEGELASRKVLSKVIPDYPEGLGREEMIRIRFTVLPNGLVEEAIPLIKGTPILEKVSLDALKQWRFSRLPPHESPKIESGEITFRYLLK